MPFDNFDAEIHSIIPYYDSFHQETINLIKASLPNPSIWLDTGCGTGTLIEKALNQFPDTRFILADPLAEMLEEAKRKLYGYPEEKIAFLKPMSTQDLSVADISNPDVITAIQSHHYLSKEERIRATRVCYDLLSKDGIYITFENIKPLTKIGTKIGLDNWRSYQLSRGRDQKTVNDHLSRFNTAFFPITVEEHLSLLRGIGYKAVELLWYSYMQAGFYCIK